MTEVLQTELPQIDPSEITLDNLKAEKFHISEIPYKERQRLKNEAFETLPEDQKATWQKGWKTKEFFLGRNRDGSPAEWKDHVQFEKEIEQNLPMKNERLKHLTKETQEKDAAIQKLQREVEELKNLQKVKIERELKKEKLTLQNKLREAKEIGDIDNYDQARQELNDLEDEEKVYKRVVETPAAPQLRPEVISFEARNSDWYKQDMKMTRYARALSAEVAAEYPNLSLGQQLQMIEDDIKREFPEKFIKKEPPRAPAVEGSGNGGFGNRSNQVTFDNLSEDEQDRIRRMIRSGAIKEKSISEFMKGYNENINKFKKQ